ncbi:hypothetical protein [Herbaspirillum lusitanum]|uniref:hypothetical protein n=1 Tax=Herbaspirillum lusitanum TaxID=213312 RepID=UPI0002E58C65|nr:hypothetical protein [Herbaspirillum lusitanum]
MSHNDNNSMQMLSLEQKHTLVHAIAEDSGLNLDYYGFLEILLGMLEDIPGFEIDKPKVKVLNEMWRIYEEMKTQ